MHFAPFLARLGSTQFFTSVSQPPDTKKRVAADALCELVVDDHKDAADVLAKGGHFVHVAYEGATGVDVVSTF